MVNITSILDILFFWDYLLKSAENLGMKMIYENPKKHCLFNQNLKKNYNYLLKCWNFGGE